MTREEAQAAGRRAAGALAVELAYFDEQEEIDTENACAIADHARSLMAAFEALDTEEA